MTGWDVFFPLVLPETPGCPNPTAELHLRMAARDFCLRSAVWREWLAPITTDGTTSLFSILLDSAWQAQVVRITDATLNGKPLDVVSRAVLPRRVRRARECCGALLDEGDGTYRLQEQPAAAGSILLVQVALMPTIQADSCGDMLSTIYQQAIADGALGRLLALANAPWAAPARAIDCRAAFEKTLHSAANADFRRADPQLRRTQPAPL